MQIGKFEDLKLKFVELLLNHLKPQHRQQFPIFH